VESTDRWSVAFPAQWWYPACPSGALGRRPLSLALMDTPLALFRDRDGVPHALVDRCPHRNVALSRGRVAGDGSLQCAYHGWRFAGDGTCVAVPGLCEGAEAAAPARRAASHPVREQDGFVWVWGAPGELPPLAGGPFGLPRVGHGAGAGEAVFSYDLDCTLHAALENALDVPHTAFLHAGIFRGGDAREVTAIRSEVPGGIEVEYVGEPVGLGRFRAGQESATTFDHWDRFFLPSIAQVEYRVEGWMRIVNTILHLPLSSRRTRAWFVVRFWSRLPAAVVKPVVVARGRQILRQDARMLAHQTQNVGRFGGERYTSTDLDLVGNAI
jgi:phenylpropionate dioxygenase-like ring-hydroxylating dioxygenase large terminal subunit